MLNAHLGRKLVLLQVTVLVSMQKKQKINAHICKRALVGCQGGVVQMSFSNTGRNTPSKPLVIMECSALKGKEVTFNFFFPPALKIFWLL